MALGFRAGEDSSLHIPSAARRAAGRLALWLFIAILAYLVVVPLVRLQSLAFADGAQGFRDAYTDPNLSDVLWTTLSLAAGSLVISLVLGTVLAYASTRLPARLRFLRVLPLLPIVVPFVATILGWIFLLSPRPGYLNVFLRRLPWWDHLSEGPIDIYTVPWIVIVTGIALTAFVYLFVRSGLENINGELIDAALVHGSSSSGAFFRVILPLLRPALLYGGGVALLLGLGQFTAPLFLGRNQGASVISTEMFYIISRTVPPDYAQAAALGAPLLLVGLAVILFQRFVLSAQMRFITHGGKAFRAGAKPSKLAAAGLLFYFLLAIVLPVAALVVVSLSPFWSANIDVDSWTLDNYRRLLDNKLVLGAIRTSVFSSLAAMAIVLPIGFIAASVLNRRRNNRIAGAILDVIVSTPLGIPTVILAVGLLMTYTREPLILYGSRWILIVVYITLMLPFATRLQLVAMSSLGETYVEASRVSGAGLVRTNVRIVLPLMRSTIAGAAALVFVLLSQEFTASLLVRSHRTEVMGTAIFWFFDHDGSYPLIAAIGLIMAGVTALGVTLAMAVGGSDVLEDL